MALSKMDQNPANKSLRTQRSTFGADPSAQDKRRRWFGVGVVMLVHGLAFWLISSGMARQVLEVIHKPVEVAIITQAPTPAEPPPPPKPVPPPPKTPPPVDTPPPLAYVPPPDIVPPPAVQPVIQAVVSTPPPAPPPVAPPPPAPAPTAPASPLRRDVSVACPDYAQVLRDALAGVFDRVGVVGVVKVQIRIQGSKIVDVTPVSGPRDYYRPVQNAVRRMRCGVDGANEVLVPLEVSFRED
ncbi:MAG: energy transducer TonB [Leptothrix ochracea]|uniref:energy transducer TonB n=1 Tax=Leptothrix ochracea TaxID=735331 RepID=UPI0034E234BF